MNWMLIINSILCLNGAFLGLFLATSSVISIANRKVPWSGWLLIAAYLVPGMFVVSGIGAWPAVVMGATQFAIGLVVLPWLYMMLFVLMMVVALRYNHKRNKNYTLIV